jgi:[ribosomal protein S18]-alanine N-acetyltransferase
MTAASTQFHIRPMTAADLDGVVQLAASLPSAPNWPRSAYEAALDKSFTPRRVALVGAGSAYGEPLAFVFASLVPPQAELESIAVAAENRRKGLGLQLFNALIVELGQLGARELTLEVRASNTAAIGFYKSLGFHFTGLRPRYYVDPIENAVMMALNF